MALLFRQGEDFLVVCCCINCMFAICYLIHFSEFPWVGLRPFAAVRGTLVARLSALPLLGLLEKKE